MSKIYAMRFHDISVGHRVVNHESKCKHFHGHNYRVHFKIAPKVGLDRIGRVLDFSVIKAILCEWLEANWDHKMVLWSEDPQAGEMRAMDPEGVHLVPFNPTAENMAEYLLTTIGPLHLPGDVELVEVKIEETYKCHAEATL
jgi:6-pyruvoyltetrahydropterin/6-carboxytetrahydropterin synthase